MNAASEPVSEPRALAALVAEFASADALVAAAAAVRDAGYTRWDCHSPLPVHGIDRAMGIRPTPLPWLVLAAGMAGAVVALLLQWWTNAIDYPMIISGKPLFSLPASIPIAFELIVLFSALAAFLGALALNQLPRWAHPLLACARFRRVTTDGMFLSIEATDPKFDKTATPELLVSLGATAVELCHEPAGSKRLPAALTAGLIVAAVLALLPPLWIAKLRSVKSAEPRIHLIQDMDHQPKYQAQQASRLFEDGRAMRPPVAGTVAQGGLETDDHLYRGKRADEWATTFPMPVTAELARRGRESFNVMCAPCHGLDGAGDGMVSQRAFKRSEPEWVRPTSIHDAAVAGQPVGQLFATITGGVRRMPGYASQTSAAERWAIVLYLRALQRSQRATIGDVPEPLRGDLR